MSKALLILECEGIVRAVLGVVEAVAPTPEEFQKALARADSELEPLAQMMPKQPAPLALATLIVDGSGEPISVNVAFSGNLFEIARAVIAEKRTKGAAA